MGNEYINKQRLLNFIEENNDENDWMVNQYNADWIYSFIENAPACDVVSRDELCEKLISIKKELITKEKYYITEDVFNYLIDKIRGL